MGVKSFVRMPSTLSPPSHPSPLEGEGALIKGRSAESIAMRLAVSHGTHVVIPPVFGAIGTMLGLGPIFRACAARLGGGSFLNRKKAD